MWTPSRYNSKLLASKRNKENDIVTLIKPNLDLITRNSTRTITRKDTLRTVKNAMTRNKSSTTLHSTSVTINNIVDYGSQNLANKMTKLYKEISSKKEMVHNLKDQNIKLALKIQEEFNHRKEYTLKYDEELCSLRNLSVELDSYITEYAKRISILRDVNQTKVQIINDLKQNIAKVLSEMSEYMKDNEIYEQNFLNTQELVNLQQRKKDLIAKIQLLQTELFKKNEIGLIIEDEINEEQIKERELDISLNEFLKEQIEKEKYINPSLEEYRNHLAEKCRIDQTKEEMENALTIAAQELQNVMKACDLVLQQRNKYEQIIVILSKFQNMDIKEYNEVMRLTDRNNNSENDDEYQNERLLLIYELEKLKYDVQSQKNDIAKLENDDKELEQKEKNQNKEIEIIENKLKNIKNSLLSESQPEYKQSRSILTQKMEN